MKYFFFILLFSPLFLHAQSGLFGMGTVSYTQADTTHDYLIDSGVTAPFAAYPLRRVDPNYTGKLVTIRRSTNSDTLDIGATAAGDFDAAAFTAFISGGQGFVKRIYNQYGTFHAVQDTIGKQPLLLLNVTGGRVAMYFDGVDDYLEIKNIAAFEPLHRLQATVSILFQPGTTANPDTLYPLVTNNGNWSNRAGYIAYWDDRASVSRNEVMGAYVSRGIEGSYVSFQTSTGWAANNWHNFLQTLNNDPLIAAIDREALYKSGVLVAQTNTATQTRASGQAAYNMLIGYANSERPENIAHLKGYISEVVFWNVQLTQAMITSVTRNQNNYFNIP